MMTPAERSKKWRDKNREKVNAYNKAYRENPENKEKRKKYLQDNKDRIRESNKKHRESAQSDPKRFVGYLLQICKSGAKSRDIIFKLTREDIESLIVESKGKCAISGMGLSTEYNSPFKASIDRIDSDKGYTRDNVQLVATMVNIAKNKYSMELFVKMCKAVARKNK